MRRAVYTYFPMYCFSRLHALTTRDNRVQLADWLQLTVPSPHMIMPVICAKCRIVMSDLESIEISIWNVNSRLCGLFSLHALLRRRLIQIVIYLELSRWLIDWLVFYGTSTQDRSICANLPGGLLAQAFEDSQRGTYKNIQLYASWVVSHTRLVAENIDSYAIYCFPPMLDEYQRTEWIWSWTEARLVSEPLRMTGSVAIGVDLIRN